MDSGEAAEMARVLDEYEILRQAGRECEAALRALLSEDSWPVEDDGRGGSDRDMRLAELEERARQLRALRRAQLPLVRAVAERLGGLDGTMGVGVDLG